MLKLFDNPSQIINLDAVLRRNHICKDGTHLNKAGMKILRWEIGKNVAISTKPSHANTLV